MVSLEVSYHCGYCTTYKDIPTYVRICVNTQHNTPSSDAELPVFTALLPGPPGFCNFIDFSSSSVAVLTCSLDLKVRFLNFLRLSAESATYTIQQSVYTSLKECIKAYCTYIHTYLSAHVLCSVYVRHLFYIGTYMYIQYMYIQ